MSEEKFKLLIESIGFKYNVHRYYEYKNYQIDLFEDIYDFFDGYYWNESIPLNDLKPLEKEFKQAIRSIKLKNILG